MVADIEEAKQKNTVRDRLKGGGGGGPAKRLKTSGILPICLSIYLTIFILKEYCKIQLKD